MVMEWLNSFLGNYGWSIVVFTILFRLAISPLDFYQRVSMRKQSDVQKRMNPKLEALKKKYQNDPQKLQSKTMELYKEEHFNPITGCLPMIFILVLQFPIFIAFFNVIRNLSGEQILAMYEAAKAGREIVPYGFLWVHNLWQPDTFMATVITEEAGIGAYKALANITDYGAVMSGWIEQFSAYRNGWGILPVAAAAINYFQSKLTQQQQVATPESASSSKMMMWMMPVISLVFCWTSSAAFALYWTVSSIMAVLSNLLISWIFRIQERKKADQEGSGKELST